MAMNMAILREPGDAHQHHWERARRSSSNHAGNSSQCGESLVQSPRFVRRLYIHERPDWPRLRWRSEAVADALADVRRRQAALAVLRKRAGTRRTVLVREAALQSSA